MPIGLGWREGGIPEPEPGAEDWWKNTAYPALGGLWDWVKGNPVEAASASMVPGVSDVADIGLLGRDLYRFGTEPSRENAVSLGLGAAGAALPLVGAGALKAGRKALHGADIEVVPALAKTEMRQLVGGGGSLEEAQGRLQQLGPGHGLRRSPTHPGVYFTVREPQAPEVGAAAAPTSSEPAHFVFKADPATSETVERLAGRVTSGVNDRAGLGNKGQYVYDNNSILLDSSLSPEQRHDTLTHELGHAMAAKGGVVDPRGLAWQGAPPAQVLEQIRALSAGRRPHLWGSNEELENAFPHLGAAAISKYRERPDELAADLVASMIADPAKAKQVGHEAYRWAASKLNASDLGKIAQFLGVPLAMVSAALAQASGLEPEEAPPPPATAGGIGLGR
jgi:hypothetical protein